MLCGWGLQVECLSKFLFKRCTVAPFHRQAVDTGNIQKGFENEKNNNWWAPSLEVFRKVICWVNSSSRFPSAETGLDKMIPTSTTFSYIVVPNLQYYLLRKACLVPFDFLLVLDVIIFVGLLPRERGKQVPRVMCFNMVSGYQSIFTSSPQKQRKSSVLYEKPLS